MIGEKPAVYQWHWPSTSSTDGMANQKARVFNAETGEEYRDVVEIDEIKGTVSLIDPRHGDKNIIRTVKTKVRCEFDNLVSPFPEFSGKRFKECPRKNVEPIKVMK